MFESICIKRQDDFVGNPIDLGFLAEALLFYQRVHIVADGSILKFLLRTCGMEVLFDLLESGILTMTYLENGTGIRTHDQGKSTERHDFIVWEAPSSNLQVVAPTILQELTGKSGKGRRLANRLIPLIKSERFTQAISQDAMLDLQDREYLQIAISQLLHYFVPEYQQPSPLHFEVVPNPEGFTLRTNIDFSIANQSYHARVAPVQNSLSGTLLLGVLAAARDDIQSAAQISGDLAVPKGHSIIARCKFEELIRKRTQSEKTIEQFQDLVLKDGRAVAEAVNNGSRNMADVLELLKKAEKFKKWVKDQPEDSALRDQYCQEIMKTDWADKLPAKSVRFALFTALGSTIGLLATPVVGTAAGIALGASDTFLLDKLIKGWRPNQFVQGPLEDFIR